MKKFSKILLSTLLVLLLLVIAAVTGVLLYVNDGNRLANLVNGYAKDYLTCETQIGSIDYSLFSSWPDFTIEVKDVVLLNPMEETQNDTLFRAKSFKTGIDLRAFLFDDRIVVNGLSFDEGKVNLFIDAEGRANFDVVVPSDEHSEESSNLDIIKLQDIEVHDFSATFLDRQHNLEGRVMGVNIDLWTDAKLMTYSGNAKLSVEADEIYYSDEVNYAHISDFVFKDCELWSDGKNATLKMANSSATDQEYLLSGDVGLFAHLWNYTMNDIHLRWQDGMPTIAMTSAMDSAAVTIGSEDFTNIQVGQVNLDLPVSSTAEEWTARVKSSFQDVTVESDVDGLLAQHLDVVANFVGRTNTTFSDFYVDSLLTMLDGQSLSGKAHCQIVDSTLLLGDVDFQLGSTSLAKLFALVPDVYGGKDLRALPLRADLDETHVAASCEIRNDVFTLSDLALNGRVNHFDYNDKPSAMQASIGSSSVEARVHNYCLNDNGPEVQVKLEANDMSVVMDDTMSVALNRFGSQLNVDMKRYGKRIGIQGEGDLDGLKANLGGGMEAQGQSFDFKGKFLYDDTKSDLSAMLSPEVELGYKQVALKASDLPCDVVLPVGGFSYAHDIATLRKLSMHVGNSDFTLDGKVRNISAWMDEKPGALLTGDLRLSSQMLDADQLMDLVSGFGTEENAQESANNTAESTTAPAEAAAAASTDSAMPFMVPKGVDLTFATKAVKVRAGGSIYENVGGQLTCRDGALALEEMGFTAKAARMQLTALYKSPRENNLWVGWNFHLLDIDIAEMISLVPAVDSIVPMLSSFAGKAEFHLAGETNLFRDYSPKMSTLKAVAAIDGSNLTVLDNETFQTIKKYLFKESTTNKIDTLSVELAVARKKMTLYPMLVSWDKYQAVISGSHTIVEEMPFNYHISITKCPLVGGHLGLDITGDLDNPEGISFNLGSCKYANLYRPEKRNITQSQTLELKSLINTSLKRTVKE